MSRFSDSAETFNKLESIVTGADEPWGDDEVNAHRAAIEELFAATGLDPADRDHRRAFALGLCAAQVPTINLNLITAIMAALRPAVRAS